MSEMVERVAEAIYHSFYINDGSWNRKQICVDVGGREDFLKAARNTITAMREPTAEMLEGNTLHAYEKAYVKAEWRRLIDEALR